MATLCRKGLTSLFGNKTTVNYVAPSVYSFNQNRQLSEETMKKFKGLKVEEVKPFVYNVQLNRPEKMNALNKTLWGEIGEVFRELGNDPDCRVVVLSGNGKMFCSGIDLNDFVALGSIIQSDTDAARKARNLYPLIRQYQLDFLEIEKCPKPVIFAIHNACVGGATNMACFGDIRYCTKDAWFQVKETALGLAADVGVLQYLPKIVGNQSLVRELCFTARKIPSDEAEKIGLVSRVFEDKEALMKGAIELAEMIASLSPVAIQTTKINLNYARDNKVAEALDFGARFNMVCLQTDDLMKAAMAHMTKSPEPPTFSKL